MMNKKSGHRHFRRKALIALPILVLVLAGLSVAGFLHYHDRDKKVAITSTSATRPQNTINYTPVSGSNNDNNARKGSSTSTPTLDSSSTPVAFNVTISRASASGSSITAAANVNGVSSGTCVFNFSTSSGGAAAISSSSEQVQPNNQSAECPPVSVTMPHSGTWYVSVTVTNQGSTSTANWLGTPPTTS